MGYYIENIDKAMASTSLPDDTTVYRGIRDQALVNKLYSTNIGDEIINFGYTSTSISFGFAREWSKGNMIIVVKAQKGTKSIYMPSISKKFTDEFELLLDRGLSFSVVDKYIKNGIKYLEVEVK